MLQKLLWLRLLLLLLLLLLLELRLVLLWNGGQGRSWEPRLEGGLRRGRLAEAGKLRLKLSGALQRLEARRLGLHAGEASVLSGKRSLAEARGLRRERARLLLLGLPLRLLAGPEVEGASSILLRTLSQAIAAEEGVGARIHDEGFSLR